MVPGGNVGRGVIDTSHVYESLECGKMTQLLRLFGALPGVCVCVRVTGSVAEINWVSLSAVTGQPSLTADCMCVALCRLEKKL